MFGLLEAEEMSVRILRFLFTALAAMMFAAHVQAMDHARPALHEQSVSHASPAHHDRQCASGCCASSACCIQAAESSQEEVFERHPTVFRIVSCRVRPTAAVRPPDPPPRSRVA